VDTDMNTLKNTRIVVALIGVTGAFMAAASGLGHAASKDAAPNGVPIYEVDPKWPVLPNEWVTGPVSSVATDRRGHVWLIHRRRDIPSAKKANAAPPILEFDEHGMFIKSWGGPGAGYDWPANEHGLFVDDQGNFWITGSNPQGGDPTLPTDNMVLKFDPQGKFLMEIGGKGQPGGNQDTKYLERPTNTSVYSKTQEVFVADGYGNRRVIVFDANTGTFKRMWGAFGKPPDTNPPAPLKAGTRPTPNLDGDGPLTFNNPVHCAVVSQDGFLYVCDRTNRRMQVFTVDGKYVTQVFINKNEEPSVSGVVLSQDPRQKYIFAADYGNSRIAVVDRKTLHVVYQFGRRGNAPGEFQGLHNIAIDPKGNLYTGEVVPGNRIQRFIYKGLGPMPSSAAAPPHLPD
jgi:DNA-binding beta-propeller fold protein YncE